MQQKVVITQDQDEINSWLEMGWEIVSVTPQPVAIATGNSYGTQRLSGDWAFVIQKRQS
jgi:hypothetical protein